MNVQKKKTFKFECEDLENFPGASPSVSEAAVAMAPGGYFQSDRNQ